jgi:hypothetical protein
MAVHSEYNRMSPTGVFVVAGYYAVQCGHVACDAMVREAICSEEMSENPFSRNLSLFSLLVFLSSFILSFRPRSPECDKLVSFVFAASSVSFLSISNIFDLHPDSHPRSSHNCKKNCLRLLGISMHYHFTLSRVKTFTLCTFVS